MPEERGAAAAEPRPWAGCEPRRARTAPPAATGTRPGSGGAGGGRSPRGKEGGLPAPEAGRGPRAAGLSSRCHGRGVRPLSSAPPVAGFRRRQVFGEGKGASVGLLVHGFRLGM